MDIQGLGRAGPSPQRLWCSGELALPFTHGNTQVRGEQQALSLGLAAQWNWLEGISLGELILAVGESCPQGHKCKRAITGPPSAAALGREGPALHLVGIAEPTSSQRGRAHGKAGLAISLV